MHRSTCILGPAVSKFLAEFQYDSSGLEFIQKRWFCALAFMLATPLCLQRSKVSLRYFSHPKKEHLNMIWRTPGSQNPFHSVMPMPLCSQQCRTCLSSSGSTTCINSPGKSPQDVQKIFLYLRSSGCPRNLLVSQLIGWLCSSQCLSFSLTALCPGFPVQTPFTTTFLLHSTGALLAGTQGALPEQQGSPQSHGTKLDPRSCLSSKSLMCKGAGLQSLHLNVQMCQQQGSRQTSVHLCPVLSIDWLLVSV